MTRPTLSTHGLAYWKKGENGTPVFFIMGFGMPGFAWNSQTQIIAQTHQVAFYDHYGIGESQLPPLRKHTMEKMADDALTLLDELSWPKAHIVGVSMGGMIAQHLALRAPERIKSLSLIATSSVTPHPSWRCFSSFIKIALAKTPEQKLKATQKLLFSKDYIQTLTEEQHEEQLRSYGTKVPFSILKTQLRAVMKHDTRQKLRGLTHSTLILQPKKDLMIHPKESETLHKHLPNAELLSFEEAGHGILRQCQQDVNDALLSHFQRFESPAPSL